jgi:hypothetical protein
MWQRLAKWPWLKALLGRRIDDESTQDLRSKILSCNTEDVVGLQLKQNKVPLTTAPLFCYSINDAVIASATSSALVAEKDSSSFNNENSGIVKQPMMLAGMLPSSGTNSQKFPWSGLNRGMHARIKHAVEPTEILLPNP